MDIEADIFHWDDRLMGDVEFAAPLVLADVDPVGGLTEGAAEAIGLNKGSEQNRAVAVALLPTDG